MIVYNKIENTIEYVTIEYDVQPNIEELIESLDIIKNSERCMVISWLEYNPKNHKQVKCFMKGKLHNEFGFAIADFYGINGDIMQKGVDMNDVSIFIKKLRKLKLDKLKKI